MCQNLDTHARTFVQGDFPATIPSSTFQAQAAQAVSSPANQVAHGSCDRHASGELLHNMIPWLCIQSCEVQEALPVKPQKFTQKALICLGLTTAGSTLTNTFLLCGLSPSLSFLSSRTCLGQSVGMRVVLHALSMDGISLAINLDGCWEFFEANIVKPSISKLSRL